LIESIFEKEHISVDKEDFHHGGALGPHGTMGTGKFASMQDQAKEEKLNTKQLRDIEPTPYIDVDSIADRVTLRRS
jgi:hypothetical protein